MTTLALLGYGTVGTGFIELVDKNKNRGPVENSLEVTSILVKNKDKHRGKNHFSLVTDSIDDVFSRPLDILVEVIGGLHPAYEYVKKALLCKKHVITANKDLIAEYGDELLTIAKEQGVILSFEASVGGGIPIISPMVNSLVGNDISTITAILNGTTNFILTKMSKDNMSYKDALSLAQNLGFAESNPEADVMGYDAARKLSILSTLGFRTSVPWADIPTEGIVDIKPIDFEFANTNNFTIKLVAKSFFKNNSIFSRVSPMLVPNDSPLYSVDNEFNMIYLYGDAVGDVTFYGKGAGMFPTASSIYSDVINAILENKNCLIFNNEKIKQEKYYMYPNLYMIRFKGSTGEKLLSFVADVFHDITIKELSFHEDYLLCFAQFPNEVVLENKLSKIKVVYPNIEVKSFMSI